MAMRCSSQRLDRVISSPDTEASFQQGSTLRDITPAAMLLACGLIGLVAASFSRDARPGDYLVIDAPWSTYGLTINTIRSADGRLAATGGFGNIAIATSHRSDFPARARQAGAWLVIPSPRIPGCFGLPSDTLPSETGRS